jgi:putative ATPase
MLERRRVGSMILWGPPGSGKTTIARLIAAHTDRAFVPFSAVTEGVPRVREIVGEAAERWRAEGRGTILFVDEIHRFNRGQQDAFLPHVETGTVTLVGATTENPSFELVGALLSRARVFVLEALGAPDLAALLRRALGDAERGLGALGLRADDDAVALLAEHADGDARRALTALEAAADLVGAGGRLTAGVARDALQRRVPRYDKGGEEHYNLISAYHKALRGSDPQGALYWLARMVEGGEDPMYIARRTVRFASEDVGLADPEALRLAVAARDAYQFLGSPEGELALAEAAVYLATAPKSNRVYEGWKAALAAARETPAAPVPHHLRNAPTRLMKDLGYGAGYQYAHAVPEAYTPQEYLPDALRGAEYYAPGPFGFEREVGKRLAWWRELRARLGGRAATPPARGRRRRDVLRRRRRAEPRGDAGGRGSRRLPRGRRRAGAGAGRAFRWRRHTRRVTAHPPRSSRHAHPATPTPRGPRRARGRAPGRLRHARPPGVRAARRDVQGRERARGRPAGRVDRRAAQRLQSQPFPARRDAAHVPGARRLGGARRRRARPAVRRPERRLVRGAPPGAVHVRRARRRGPAAAALGRRQLPRPRRRDGQHPDR